MTRLPRATALAFGLGLATLITGLAATTPALADGWHRGHGRGHGHYYYPPPPPPRVYYAPPPAYYYSPPPVYYYAPPPPRYYYPPPGISFGVNIR